MLQNRTGVIFFSTRYCEVSSEDLSRGSRVNVKSVTPRQRRYAENRPVVDHVMKLGGPQGPRVAQLGKSHGGQASSKVARLKGPTTHIRCSLQCLMFNVSFDRTAALRVVMTQLNDSTKVAGLSADISADAGVLIFAVR